MKILQINAVNAVGSTGRNCFELSDFLFSQGHICVNAYSNGQTKNSEYEFIIGSLLDRKFHALLSRISGLQAYFSKSATKKLLRYIEELQPDIIVLHNLHGNFINLPLLLSFLAKNDISTAIVLHDCWFFTGKCCHYTIDNCYKWQSGCGGCKSLKKYNKSWFFDRTAKMIADKERMFCSIPRLGVISVSDWLASEAKQSPVFKNAKKIKRIYNWIDLEQFKPYDSGKTRKKYGLCDKKIILCVASSWSHEKGIDTVLNLANRLESHEKIVIVGNMPSKIVLNEKILNLPITHSVQELAELYSMADVFLQPSLEETFGKVSAEALACGTPVVCFRSTANSEIVGRGCGAIIDVGDEDKLIEEIRRILSYDKSEFSQRCCDFAKKNFDMEANLTKYIDFFDKLIKQ